MLNILKPDNALPLVPPKVDLHSKKLLLKAIAAHRALAELNAFAKIIPNQSILINSLTLKEAKDSSEIENIITTHDELFKAFSMKSEKTDASIKEVLRYKDALWFGYDVVKKKDMITVNSIVKIQELLLNNNAGIRKLPGTSLKNDKTGKVINTKLKNLEAYINNGKEITDPLIKMAVMHYQFESIHPFYDGNGRTGRILNVLYLILEHLLDLPLLYMSSYIIKNKKDYYRLLNEVRTKNKWEAWVLFMLDCVEQTANDTTQKIKQIKTSFDKTVIKIKTELPKIYTKELVEVLYYQPYCKISFLVDNNIAARQAASRYLVQLEEAGILKSEKVGRDSVYINVELFNLLKK
jgi:Fic family protein